MDDWAERRGLPVGLLERYGLHISAEGSEYPGWLAFPYPNLSGVWYHRYRHPTESEYRTPKGARTRLYNPEGYGPNTDEIWFCEGEFDTLVLLRLGVPAVGVPGTSTVEKNPHWFQLFESATIIVAFDGDQAGRSAAGQVVRKTGAIAFDVPDDMDLNDWYLEDQDEFTEEIKHFREVIG